MNDKFMGSHDTAKYPRQDCELDASKQLKTHCESFYEKRASPIDEYLLRKTSEYLNAKTINDLLAFNLLYTHIMKYDVLLRCCGIEEIIDKQYYIRKETKENSYRIDREVVCVQKEIAEIIRINLAIEKAIYYEKGKRVKYSKKMIEGLTKYRYINNLIVKVKKVLTVGKVKDDGSLGDSDLSVLKLSLEADNTAKKDDIIRLKEILATSRQSLANKKVYCSEDNNYATNVNTERNHPGEIIGCKYIYSYKCEVNQMAKYSEYLNQYNIGYRSNWCYMGSRMKIYNELYSKCSRSRQSSINNSVRP